MRNNFGYYLEVTSATQFKKGDFRSGYFTPERLKDLDGRIAQLSEVVESSSEVDSMISLALRYILNFQEVSAIIPGMRKLAHVQENLRLSDKSPLSELLMDELQTLAWNRNFYGGNAWEE